MYIGTKPQSGFISQEANQYFTGLTQNYIDLNQSISSLSSVIVLVNGVVQENSDLTLTSSTRITLGATLVSADKVTCIYVAKISSTQAPAVGTVTNDMLSGSITASKLSSTAVDNTNTNSTLVTGQTAITSLADTDKFLVSDASDSGNLKYVEKQYMPSGAMTLLNSTDLSSGVTEFIDRDFFTTYSSYKHFILDVQLICPSSNADLRCVFQDGSGDVTEEEMKRATEILELELREEKAEAQKRMSWVSILSMVVFTAVLFTPVVSESRVNALGDLLGLFYLGQASIVGFYFGAQAYMSRK